MLIPDLGYGGAHLSFAKIATYLSKMHEVHCVVFNLDRKQSYLHPGKVHFLDPDSLANRSTTAIGRFEGRLRKLKLLRETLKIEATLSFLEGADYVNYFAGGPGKRYAAIRGSKQFDLEINGVRGMFRHWIMRRIYPRFDAVLAVSQGLAKELRQFIGVPNSKIIVTPNFYDISVIKEQIREPLAVNFRWIFEGRRCLVAIGRLHIQKNFRFLIRTFARVKQVREDVRLVLIGDGPEENDLVELSKILGLNVWTHKNTASTTNDEADICFLGYQENPLSLASRCEILLFPSLYEGFPNALVEAMLCGLVIIAADCPHGPREILGVDLNRTDVSQENLPFGVLLAIPNECSEKDQLAWCTSVIHLLNRNTRLMGEMARERALVFTGIDGYLPWLKLFPN